MELQKLKAATEGLLFAAGEEGLSRKQLVKILEVDKETVDVIVNELKYDYEHKHRGITIMQSADFFHLTTKPEHAYYFERLVQSPTSTRLSQAALETLAIIAYNQPITRTEIEDIRGVSSDGPVQTLLSRGLIEEAGRKDTSGRPILFTTTKQFLSFFGLTTIEDLPPLPEDLVDESIELEADLFFEKFKEE
ncbi:SMC-Scp complex subunit ScpB [Salinibacillus xinjiangensis]|uniref:Segregation and condensation protein B n=1 Tax=Salinibacillus xinjiangensis TaxID=1229268 RepID=A0A6G1X6C2_9BACI|nr:SMC-Scp complex subunit ScpB [Salinibacillus xinjiangensis]MRG86455.1 SMC-Scp complex subunit ScpB [Salinibacillus xinjiangensis]